MHGHNVKQNGVHMYTTTIHADMNVTPGRGKVQSWEGRIAAKRTFQEWSSASVMVVVAPEVTSQLEIYAWLTDSGLCPVMGTGGPCVY